MSLIRKLIAGVVLVTALAGTASALEIGQVNVGATQAQVTANNAPSSAAPGAAGFTFGGGSSNTAITTAAPISTTTATANTSAYSLASEIKWSAQGGAAGPDDGNVTIVLDASTGNFPVGNLLGTLTLTGASFNANVTGSIFKFDCNAQSPTPNANLSSGGGAGTASAVFILSNLNSCVNGDFGIAITVPVDLGTSSTSTTVPTGSDLTPTISFNLTDPNGPQVDGGPAAVRIATIAPAFSVTVTATPTAQNWAALKGPTSADGIFTTLAADAVSNGTSPNAATIGAVQLVIKPSTFVNLLGDGSNAGIADDTDVTRFGLLLASLNSQFQGFSSLSYAGATGSYDMTSGGGTFASNTVELASSGNGSIGTGITPLVVNTFTGGARVITLTDAASGSRNVAILASGFTLTPSITLELTTFNSPGVNGVPALATTTLGSIFRQGTTVTFPWFSSGTQAAATGSTSILRIGNLTGVAINAYIATFDSSLGTTGNVAAKTIAAVPANGELVMNSAQAEAAAGANFGRADVQIILETNPGNVTARRFVFNGASFTELSPGTAGAPVAGGPQ